MRAIDLRKFNLKDAMRAILVGSLATLPSELVASSGEIDERSFDEHSFDLAR